MGTPSWGVHLCQHSGRWHWACLVAKEKLLLWVGSLPPREPGAWAVSRCCLPGGLGPAGRCCRRPAVCCPPCPRAARCASLGCPQDVAGGLCLQLNPTPPSPPQAWPQCTIVLGSSLRPGPGPQVQVAQQDPAGAQPLWHGLCSLQGHTRACHRGQVSPASPRCGTTLIPVGLRVSRGWWLRAGEGPGRV